MSRHGNPIQDVHLRKSVRTGIEYGSVSYPLWDAAIAAGASLDELERLDEGEYSIKMQAKLIAWHQLHQLVEAHKEEARIRAAEREAEKS